MSDHLIRCDTCGKLLYPGSLEHTTHACARSAMNKPLSAEEMAVKRVEEHFQATERDWPAYGRSLVKLYLQGHSSRDEEVRALREKIISIIDKSGIEDIYNWGAPLREIREALQPGREGEGV